jgi:hypothetical protein
MDRNLRVLEGDILFAELSFNYETQTAGWVWVTVFGSELLTGGFYASIPLVTYQTQFSHATLTTFAEIESWDRSFLKAQPAPPHIEGHPEIIVIDYNDSMTFVYDDVHYRYVFNDPFAGIADIYSNFIENTKELKFISGRNVNGDGTASSNSFETNLNFCIAFSNEHLNNPPTGFLKLS